MALIIALQNARGGITKLIEKEKPAPCKTQDCHISGGGGGGGGSGQTWVVVVVECRWW